MKKAFNNLILNNYGDLALRADVEETTKDLDLAILYEDHGDEFLYLKKKNGHEIRYGYWLNRCGTPDYDNIPEGWFIRNPILWMKEDECGSVSNEIYRYIDRNLYDHFRFKVKTYDEFLAQVKFEFFCNFMDMEFEKGVRYRAWDHKSTVLRFLEANNIATEENLKRLETIPFSTKVNGVEGVAGKRACDGLRFIHCDSVKFIWKDGRFIKIKKFMEEDDGCDEWGIVGYTIDLNRLR